MELNRACAGGHGPRGGHRLGGHRRPCAGDPRRGRPGAPRGSPRRQAARRPRSPPRARQPSFARQRARGGQRGARRQPARPRASSRSWLLELRALSGHGRRALERDHQLDARNWTSRDGPNWPSTAIQLAPIPCRACQTPAHTAPVRRDRDGDHPHPGSEPRSTSPPAAWRRGRGAGLASAFGVEAGTLVHIAAAAFGLSALIALLGRRVRLSCTYAGAAYLLKFVLGDQGCCAVAAGHAEVAHLPAGDARPRVRRRASW